ncbi:MAG TPA: GNAT family N-acetyltransferase [Steroidobacteraceae bacterium]|nr:GNAT family N-acetyltransferase [Steroidobacteraceae bacterium]
MRRLGLADLPAALRFTQQQNWSHRLEDWEFHVRLGRGWAACDRGGELLGTAVWWPWGASVGTVGLVLVRNDRQGQGIGARLMDVVLEDAGARTLHLVATQAGLGTYRRLGFVERGAILQCQGHLARVPLPVQPVDASLRSASGSDLDSLCELDEHAFGAPRPQLIRAVHEAGGGGIVAIRAGAPAGFALQRLSGRGMLIGPVVAQDELLAIALVSRLLASGSGFTRADIPADAEALAAHLAAAGIARVDEYACMVRGEPRPRHRAAQTYALASQALN